MQNSLEPPSTLRIGEYALTQMGAAQTTRIIQTFGPECGSDFGQCRLAGFDQLASDEIGIDDRRAV